MASKSIKEQTVSSAKWNGIERLAVQGIQFLLTLVLARFYICLAVRNREDNHYLVETLKTLKHT